VEEKAVLKGALQTIVSVKGVDENYTSINKMNSPNTYPRGKFELGRLPIRNWL
jgi:hypothetical protein